MSIEFPLHGKFEQPRIRALRVSQPMLSIDTAAIKRMALGKSLVGRIARVAAVTVALGLAGVGASLSAYYASATPRGVMYDVGGGRRMRLVCEGQPDASRPTVLFESGAFGFSGDWAHVQSQLTAQGVRSCAYDRAGMGLSDPAAEPRDGVNVSKDLEKLLAVAHEQGQFVIVGHSMAGARLHLFANRNKDRVAGLVFVDTTPAEATDKPMVAQYIKGFADEAHAAARTAPWGILRFLAATSLGDKVGLPREEDIEKRWQFGAPSYTKTAYDESKNWPTVGHQALATGSLDPKWPVAVVSAGVTEGVEGPTMQAVQPAPALASEHGYVAVVDGATHNGLLTAQYAPAVVHGIDFVLRTVREAKNDTRPSTTIMATTIMASGSAPARTLQR